ncbi:MAG: hypothetical protein H7267_08755, partial [Sandarakinorhabdus sp.]|nr:hypothetical protein [Sandarakinorhabdus sp.]
MSETALAGAGFDVRSVADRARALAADPAIQKARPAIFVVTGLIIIALVWLAMRAPAWQSPYVDLSDGD